MTLLSPSIPGHRRGESLLDVHIVFFGDVEHDLDDAPADEGEFRLALQVCVEAFPDPGPRMADLRS